jgi:uncharacterized protein (DUF952 family)
MTKYIYHLASFEEWHHAQRIGEYRPKGFDKEGFIHCSHLRQLVEVANRYFRGRKDMVLLVIDLSKLRAQVIEENLAGGAMLFPHIYGPLPVTAVADTLPFPCQSEGTFQLPPALQTG